jgi:hypothetical protein
MDSGPTITTQNESTTPESPGKDNKIQRRYNMRQPYRVKPGDGHLISWRGHDKPGTDLDRPNRLPFRPEKDAEPGARMSGSITASTERRCPILQHRTIDDRAMAAPFKEKWVMTMSPR